VLGGIAPARPMATLAVAHVPHSGGLVLDGPMVTKPAKYKLRHRAADKAKGTASGCSRRPQRATRPGTCDSECVLPPALTRERSFEKPWGVASLA
jgi:hypothetical protein